MNLAYVTNLNGVGGGTTNADRLCRAFSELDEIDVTAIHAQGTDAPENFWTDELGYDALYPRSLKAGIEAVDPDIVFVHGFNVEMIDWLRDYADGDDRAYVWRNGVNTMEQWLTLNQHGSVRKVLAPVYDLDFFDAIFAPSHAAAERLRFNYGDDCPPLAVAPCTIDYGQFVPEPFIEGETLRIATASRIAPNNYVLGPLLAVRRLIEEEGFDVDMEIMSAGDRPYPAAVETVAADLDEVRIVGHLPADEVQAHLQHADVVCVPSVTHQAVPTVAIEAMAAGNVVMCAPFHTINEEDALIRLPMDHPPSWWQALRDVAHDRESALDAVREGIHAAKHYDTDRVVRDAYLPTLRMVYDDVR